MGLAKARDREAVRIRAEEGFGIRNASAGKLASAGWAEDGEEGSAGDGLSEIGIRPIGLDG
jgi:hypothetical protein